MKNIITFLFGLVFAIGLMTTVAQAQTFNTDPRDMATILVANVSQGGCTSGAVNGCWRSSVSANEGDVVAVHLYYHNTGSTSASNVALGFNPQITGQSTSHTFRGGILVNGSSIKTGSATVQLSSSQTLTFIPGSARWFPNQQTTGRSISGESALFDNMGYSIGSVTPGWSGQGSMVIHYRVSNTQTPPPPIQDQCRITSFFASPTLVTSGSSSSLSWSTFGCTNVTLDGMAVSASGSRNTGSLFTGRSFELRAFGFSGVQTQTVFVGVQQIGQPPVQTQPQAVTTVATLIGQSSAQLNGLAITNNLNGGTTWFEWGITQGLGNRTNSQTINQSGSVQVSDGVVNLLPNTRYYYRIGVSTQFGTVYGGITSFVTTQRTVNPPIVNPPRQIIRETVVARSAPSLLELRIENLYTNMCVGGELEYRVYYRNISSQTLENTVLRVTLPKELTYLQASRGKFEVVDRTLTIDLGEVRAGEQGEVLVRTRVNREAVVGNLSVATATVVYTNTLTRGQEDAIAYSLITVTDDCPNLLGASAFGIWSFLPNTLIEWLLLILIILALVVLVRQMTKKKEV